MTDASQVASGVSIAPSGILTRVRHFKLTEDFILGLMPYIVLIILVAWLAVLQPASFTVSRLRVVANITLVLVLMSIGETFVVLGGGLDISLGGVLSAASAIIATQTATESRLIIVLALLLLLGWLPGLINGLLIVKANIQPFIVTLSTWFIWAGVALTLLDAPGGNIYPALAALSAGKILGVPLPVLLLILTALVGGWLSRTKLGLDIRAVGSDREAAFNSGVNVERTQILSYGLSSYFTVLAAIYLTAQSMSGDPKVGNTFILPAFAAVVIGGTSLAGGVGSITGTIIGAIVLSYLTSVTFALKLQVQWSQIFQGLLLIFSVSLHFVVQLLFRGRRGEVG